MKSRTFLAAAAIAALAAPAMAQPVRPGIGLAKAVETAERELGARAFDAELDHEGGALVYEIDLVKEGRALEARVDAASGQVVRQSGPSRVRLPFSGRKLEAAQSAPRTLTETIALVENATKGRVSEIGLERAGGRDYYEVELAGAQDREVRVDLRTGAITPVIDD